MHVASKTLPGPVHQVRTCKARRGIIQTQRKVGNNRQMLLIFYELVADMMGIQKR
jgi:hypothetical protein